MSQDYVLPKIICSFEGEVASKQHSLKACPEDDSRYLEAQLMVNEKPTGLRLKRGGKNVSLKLNLILVLEISKLSGEVTPLKSALEEQAGEKRNDTEDKKLSGGRKE